MTMPARRAVACRVSVVAGRHRDHDLLLPGAIETTTLPALVRPCSTCAIASSVRSKGKVLSTTGRSFPLS
jgi:hypothetical protein